MKMIEIKEGNKTKYKYVSDDYIEETSKLEQKDLTTSDRSSIGFTDIPKERWDEIFNGNDKT